MKKETKTVAALKKQLFAAIAMVVVAAMAMTTSTYAWFVSNNQVQAKASTISAMSNAASMVIKYNATAVDSNLTLDVATLDNTELYPAQWKDNFGSNKEAKSDENPGVYQFETAFGKTLTDGTLTSGHKAVGNAEAAVTAKYAVKNVFNISTKGNNLTDLKVTGATITTGDAGNTNLDAALRVLVVCGDNWVVVNKDGIVDGSAKDAETSAATGFLNATVTKDANVEVKMYVYYDGNDSAIYTNNLPNLGNASSKITVTFGATIPNS